MFTYVKESKTVFTCDFLGAHYCEPLMVDHKITYINSYKKSLKEYFDAIFSPFLPYVRQGLEKLKQLNIDFACTSHGP
jgi:flavorubredoxin